LLPVDSAGQSVADKPRWPVIASVPQNPIFVSPGSAEGDLVQRQVIEFIHACQTASYLNTIDTGLNRRADYLASGNPLPEASVSCGEFYLGTTTFRPVFPTANTVLAIRTQNLILIVEYSAQIE
jgi:hypothetical protein